MDASITRSDTEEKDEPNVAAVNLTNEEKSLIKAFKDQNVNRRLNGTPYRRPKSTPPLGCNV